MKHVQALLTLILLAPVFPAAAQAAEATSSIGHPVAIVMIIIIALLAFVILLMANVMVSSYSIFKRRNKNKISAPLLIAGLLLAAQSVTAQEISTVPGPSGPWIAGLSNTTVIFLFAILFLELIIIFYMISVFRSFTRLKHAGVAARKKINWAAWFEKLNRTRTVDAKSEDEFNLGHDYDGIQELDNPTPPWWQWGFAVSCVFAVVYMWVYFVSYSAPNQYQELEIANTRAEEKIRAFMASSASNVDENTVTVLTEQRDLDEGKKMYVANCSACHQDDGGGSVGPNLTDTYWKHGGSINDIFRTIKYGVPEKGMKSWKDDFSPRQIAQIASFIHSLKGTKPRNPKEPEGDLVEEGVQAGDAAATAGSGE